MAYTKNFPPKIIDWFENVHFCLDTEDLTIAGGREGNYTSLNVDLYDCTQSESPEVCDQTIGAHEIVMDFVVLQQTLNVKDKENPYGYKHR